MKLQQYIKEDEQNMVLDMLKRDCQPYLKEMKGTTGFPVRYTSRPSIKYIEKLKTRKDRKPLDTPIEVHDYLDDLFKKYHGWKARSEGIFVWSHKISNPGNTYLVFPIGKYSYLYNKDIDDLYTTLDEEIFSLEVDMYIPKYKWVDYLDNKEVKEDLTKIVKNYKSKGLKSLASETSKSSLIEVMINCKEYYLVERRYEDIILDKLL